MARLRLWHHRPRHARPEPDLPRYRPRKTSLAIAVLSALAVVMAFTVAETTSHSAGPASSVSPRTDAAPTPRPADSPPTTIPTIIGTVPSPTLPAPLPRNAPAPARSPSDDSQVVNQPAPQPCTPSELAASTATDSSSYRPGSPVRVTTELRDDGGPCVFTPAKAGQYECGTSLVVDGASGDQVWPVPGQSEQCAQPSATVLQHGYTESVSVSWDQQYLPRSSSPEAQAPSGSYEAVGKWSWNGPGQQVYTLSADSAPFTIG